MNVGDAAQELGSDGFAVFEDAVPSPLRAAVVGEIARFLAVDLGDPASFGGERARHNGGIVPLHHTQAQWDLRQCPELYRVFGAIWGEAELWVSFDRAVFRPPERASGDGSLLLHWDIDPRERGPRRIQGMLYLEDTPLDRAPLAFAPRWFADPPDRLRDAPSFDPDERTIVVPSGDAVRVAAPGGALVAWDARMPHGPAPNTSSRPRISQAVTMAPPDRTGDTQRDRVALFLGKMVPEVWRGLDGQRHPEPGPPASLTPLGRKLVGLDPW
jgi:hypothetical protein